MTPETQQRLSGALSKVQKARVAALIAAADVLAQRGPITRGSLAGADVIQVAEYVIDGTMPTPSGPLPGWPHIPIPAPIRNEGDQS